MKSKIIEEIIQKTVGNIDALPGPAELLDRERIVRANGKAQKLFGRPLRSRHELPQEVTAAISTR